MEIMPLFLRLNMKQLNRSDYPPEICYLCKEDAQLEYLCDISIVYHTSIACIFPYIKHSLAVSVPTNAKLCVLVNIFDGNQTHPQQRRIAHLC
ncbi:hypothetical protein SFRURICE_011368 [Spodoptera frugiperda]|nr:hypothetical protein SFRURICE_011368 [Spodoptera frugiperda]